ncbi:hypothetical protein SUGI_0201580 [Cryptomeria japonica]|nr:hypothetical protein SUGI_0201580 [Cryptomeria japonica]
MKMVMMTMRVFVLLLLLVMLPCSSACYADERNALLAFKEGLDFTSSHYTLQSWKAFNCCAWEGVSCHPITTHIISLDLSPHSLNASWNPHDITMPWPFMSWRELRGELFQLQHLERLNLSENAFIPSLVIPSQFYKLNNLRYLSLCNSKFIGQIPKEIGNMSSLIYLDLSSNFLNDVIPMSMVKLSNFQIS